MFVSIRLATALVSYKVPSNVWMQNFLMLVCTNCHVLILEKFIQNLSPKVLQELSMNVFRWERYLHASGLDSGVIGWGRDDPDGGYVTL